MKYVINFDNIKIGLSIVCEDSYKEFKAKLKKCLFDTEFINYSRFIPILVHQFDNECLIEKEFYAATDTQNPRRDSQREIHCL